MKKKNSISRLLKKCVEFDPDSICSLFSLRRYQQEQRSEYINSGKHMLICWSRRAGKDAFTFKLADEECQTPNRRVFYFLPTIKQAVLVLIDGVLDDGRSFLETIVDVSKLKMTSRGNYLHSDNTIRYKNGSIIYLFGADTADTKIGSNANLIIFSEAGPMYDKFKMLLNKLLPSVGLTKGKIIAVSTPRYGSFFNEMFNNPEVDSEWYKSRLSAYDLTLDDGTRVYTDEDLEKKKVTMSVEEFEQEYMANTVIANNSSIYGKSIEMATYVDDFKPSSSEKVFVSMDLGVSDGYSLVFSVIRNNKVVVLHHYINNNQPNDHYGNYILSWGKQYNLNHGNFQLIIPHDGSNRMDLGNVLMSRAQMYMRQGFSQPIILRAVDVLKGIECLRSCIQHGDIMFAKNSSVTGMLNHLKSYEWQVNKSDGSIVYVPNHGKGKSSSNTADSIEYTALYFFANKYLEDKKANNSVGSFSYLR